MNAPLKKLHVTITGEQGHGKTMAMKAIADALSSLGYQAWTREAGDMAWALTGGADTAGPMYLASARIETKHPE